MWSHDDPVTYIVVPSDQRSKGFVLGLGTSFPGSRSLDSKEYARIVFEYRTSA